PCFAGCFAHSEPHTLVFDCEHQHITRVMQLNGRLRRARMMQHIRKPLLPNPEEFPLHLWIDHSISSAHMQTSMNRAERIALHDLTQPRRQTVLRVVHSQLPDTAPRLLQPLRYQLASTLYLLERELKLASVQMLRNQVKLQRRAHKVLCKRVVDLTRHAVPLRQY